MKPEEAKQITEALFRMYPNSGADNATMTGYFEFFGRLHDAPLAIEAVNDVVLVETRLPSIAALNEAYKARLRVKVGNTPALEPGDTMEDGSGFPQTVEQWQRLGQSHRDLRTKHFGDTPDPAEGTPLPRSHREFDKEWVEFSMSRYANSPIGRSM